MKKEKNEEREEGRMGERGRGDRYKEIEMGKERGKGGSETEQGKISKCSPHLLLTH